MNLAKIFLLSLIFLLSVGCAHKPVFYEGFRMPSNAEDEGCFALMRGFLKMTKPERELKDNFKKVAIQLKKKQGYEELTSLLDDLQDEVSTYGNQAFEDQWQKVNAISQEIGRKLGRNEDITAEVKELERAKDSLLDIRGSVRRPRSAYESQERLEMLRFMIDTPSKKASNIPQNQRKEEFINFIAFRQFTSGQTDREISESKDFTYWFLKNGRYDGPQNQTMEQLYHREYSRFQEAFSKMSKTEKSVLEQEGKEQILGIYNELSLFKLSERTSEKELRRGTLLLLHLFGDLDPQFRNRDFLEWLFKQGELSNQKLRAAVNAAEGEGFDLKLGDFLRQSYSRFAAFQEVPIVKDGSFIGQMKDKTKFFWQAFKKEAPGCDDLDCVNKKSRSMWSDFFSLKYYKDNFSCLAHNPVVLKSMVMDLGIIWGGLYWHYKSNEEDFQRFPFEIMANGAVFAPILAEANCRASFKSALPFGAPLPKEEVFASLAKKSGRVFKNFRGVAFKGFLSSVGLLTMTVGFDQLFLSMGEAIAKPLTLNDMIVLAPAAFLFHGAWMGFKQMAFINPMRHKVLPRLAEIIAKKSGMKKSYWLTQTLLDFAAFKAIMYYSNWDYLVVYNSIIFPMVAGSFTVGATIEHKREISESGETLDSYEGVSESGISSHTIIKEEEGEISLQKVDVDIPEETLESWADQVLSSLPKE